MPEIDFNKIEKLLMLTTSSNDNEALSAIRMANSMLKNRQATWIDVFKTKKTTNQEYPQYRSSPRETKRERIDRMFKDLENNGYQSDFIDSLHFFFKNTGKLSEKQYGWLMKIYSERVGDG